MSEMTLEGGPEEYLFSSLGKGAIKQGDVLEKGLGCRPKAAALWMGNACFVNQSARRLSSFSNLEVVYFRLSSVFYFKCSIFLRDSSLWDELRIS